MDTKELEDILEDLKYKVEWHHQMLSAINANGNPLIGAYKPVQKQFINSTLVESILIIGEARHGKDTLAEILRDSYGYKFSSSSEAALDLFIYNKLKPVFGYKTKEECFEDRVNHRSLWKYLICEYNKDDKSRLAKQIMKDNDIYVGMRSIEEYTCCQDIGMFDLVVYVDASLRKPERDVSNELEEHHADITLDNNGTEEEFTESVIKVFNHIHSKKRGHL